MTEDEVIGRRVKYNRMENERYFQSCLLGMTRDEKVEFQMRLLDGMFSVIEAVDFKKICDHSIANFGKGFIQ